MHRQKKPLEIGAKGIKKGTTEQIKILITIWKYKTSCVLHICTAYLFLYRKGKTWVNGFTTISMDGPFPREILTNGLQMPNTY